MFLRPVFLFHFCCFSQVARQITFFSFLSLLVCHLLLQEGSTCIRLPFLAHFIRVGLWFLEDEDLLFRRRWSFYIGFWCQREMHHLLACLERVSHLVAFEAIRLNWLVLRPLLYQLGCHLCHLVHAYAMRSIRFIHLISDIISLSPRSLYIIKVELFRVFLDHDNFLLLTLWELLLLRLLDFEYPASRQLFPLAVALANIYWTLKLVVNASMFVGISWRVKHGWNISCFQPGWQKVFILIRVIRYQRSLPNWVLFLNVIVDHVIIWNDDLL